MISEVSIDVDFARRFLVRARFFKQTAQIHRDGIAFDDQGAEHLRKVATRYEKKASHARSQARAHLKLEEIEAGRRCARFGKTERGAKNLDGKRFYAWESYKTIIANGGFDIWRTYDDNP